MWLDADWSPSRGRAAPNLVRGADRDGESRTRNFETTCIADDDDMIAFRGH